MMYPTHLLSKDPLLVILTFMCLWLVNPKFVQLNGFTGSAIEKSNRAKSCGEMSGSVQTSQSVKGVNYLEQHLPHLHIG